MQIREFFRLVRFEHAVMFALAVFIAETIVLGRFPPLGGVILLSLLVPVFSEMGSFSLNDLLDIETDRLNKKTDRPLVKGTLSPPFAYRFSLFAFLVSTLAAFFINLPALLIVVIFNLLAIAYNYKLKDLPLLGNMYIALTMAIPFIFGNLVVSASFNSTVLILAVLGFVSGLAREIIKTVQDFEGDTKARNAKTLPAIIGKSASIRVAAFLYLFFIPLSFLPFVFGLRQNPFSLIGVGLADVSILYILLALRSPGPAAFKKARNISLVSLFLGLVAYLMAVLI